MLSEIFFVLTYTRSHGLFIKKKKDLMVLSIGMLNNDMLVVGIIVRFKGKKYIDDFNLIFLKHYPFFKYRSMLKHGMRIISYHVISTKVGEMLPLTPQDKKSR